MKKQLIAAMIGLTALAACSKKNNSNNATPGTTLAENTWSVDGKVYKANTTEVVNGFMTAGDTSVTAYPLGITYYFYQGQIPTSTRTYKIVKAPAAADEMHFEVADSTGIYVSTDDNAGKLVTVTVAANGKLNLVAPEAITTTFSGGGVIKRVAAHLVQH